MMIIIIIYWKICQLQRNPCCREVFNCVTTFLEYLQIQLLQLSNWAFHYHIIIVGFVSTYTNDQHTLQLFRVQVACIPSMPSWCRLLLRTFH